MIEDIVKKERKRLAIIMLVLFLLLLIVFLFSLSIGHYGILNPNRLAKSFIYLITRNSSYYSTDANVLEYIRLPRTLGAILIGGALSVSGLVYQNTFNNKLVSPDILGVNAGCCVGAGIAILIGLSNYLISIIAFVVGIISVMIALLLPKLFKNKSNITLVLSGIIVGALMNSFIGIIKYTADKEDKLSSITFWMMGSLNGTQLKDLLPVLIITVVCLLVLIIMNLRIDALTLGKDEATSIGINFKANRLVVIVCSTLLTAASVSMCGSIGWVGLVIPHITRALIGNRSKETIPVSFLIGSIFMVVVDALSRTISTDEIPLSIITGILGAIIYSIVLIKKGRMINE